MVDSTTTIYFNDQVSTRLIQSLCVLITTLLLSGLAFSYPESGQHQPPDNLQANSQDLKNQSLLILRGNGNYPPHEFYKDGELTGYHVELIKLAAEELQMNIEFKDLPWKRAVALIKHGKADAITFMTKTKDREPFAIFLEDNILSLSTSGLIGTPNSKGSTRYDGSLKSIEDLTIGVQLGFNYGSEFDTARHLKKIEFIDIKMLTSSLKAGRIDVGLISHQEYQLYSRLGEMQGLVLLNPAINTFGNYLAFSKAKKNEELSQKFANALRKVKASPMNQQLLKQFPIEN